MEETLQILITGDFYGGNRIEDLLLRKDYKQIFNDFLPIIRKVDIAITNLEAPLLNNGQPIEKTGPAIKVIPETIDAIKYAGFNLLTLANNHIMDYGAEGLQSTLKLCKEKDIATVGAGKNFENAGQTYYKKVNGVHIAIINTAENEWSTTNGNTPGAHPLNPVANYYKIKEAKGQADFVIVIVHGGHEMYYLPSLRMKETYRFFVDAGADAVVGHHTHCYSGYELYNETPIFYSLGNFLFESSTQKSDYWHTGFAVILSLSKASNVTFELIPYRQSKPDIGVNLLKDKQAFEDRIGELNCIIQDDVLLEKEFNSFIENKLSKTYNAFLEPVSVKPLRLMQKIGFLPSLLNKKKKRLYLNLIRCEAHRDVVTKLLHNDSHS